MSEGSHAVLSFSQADTTTLREILRYLVIAQCVGLVIDVASGFILLPPEEITVAVELMAEEGRYEATGLYFTLLICLTILAFVLYGRALWQLYHFNRHGLSNFLWAIAAFVCGELIAPADVGSWLTPQQAALGIVPGLATGGTIALCFLAPSIFLDEKPSPPADSPDDSAIALKASPDKDS